MKNPKQPRIGRALQPLIPRCPTCHTIAYESEVEAKIALANQGLGANVPFRCSQGNWHTSQGSRGRKRGGVQ